MSQFHSLKIGDIHKATDSCVVITFEVTEQLKSAFRFKAGQYLAIKTHLDGNEIRRDYSICSSPNSGKLQVAVKAVKGGYFSNFANTVLKAGDTLEVAAPNGRFV
ncbi:MAG TPA: FAD-binding oxidoreductase, partial [Aquaticitalea sp.]|nr:FAD-binding oxidoreductase [Aquaticitalea sp.]